MPRFFFDLRDGETFVSDHLGVELVSLDAAEKEAGRTLVEIARETLTVTITRDLEVVIRDQNGPLEHVSLQIQITNRRDLH